MMQSRVLPKIHGCPLEKEKEKAQIFLPTISIVKDMDFIKYNNSHSDFRKMKSV